jgi:hypothetical protein
VGSGAARPPAADRQRLLPAPAVRAVDRVGGGHLGEPHHLPDADLLPVPVPGERVAAGAARRARRGRAAAVPVPVIRAFRGQAAAAGGICHDALPGAQPPGPVRRGPAPGRPARAHQGGLRAGGQAPGRGGVGVRPQAGRGLAALPRLAGELRAGRLQHRRAPGPGACPVVRPAGPARRRGADARAPSAQGA